MCSATSVRVKTESRVTFFVNNLNCPHNEMKLKQNSF